MLIANPLFLTNDPNAIKKQLSGETVPLNILRDLRDNISTDEITPIPALAFYDNRLGNFVWTGLECRQTNPIKKGDIINSDINVVIAGKRYGKGSSREHSPLAEKASGVKLIIAESFERIYRQNADNIGLITSTNLNLIDDILNNKPIDLNEIIAERNIETQNIIKSGGLLPYWKKNLTNNHKKDIISINQIDKPKTLSEKIIEKHYFSVKLSNNNEWYLSSDWRFIHEYYTAMCGFMLNETYGEELKLFEPESIITFEDHLPYMSQSQEHIKENLIPDLKNLVNEHRKFTNQWNLKSHKYNSDTDGSEGISHAIMAENYALPGQLIIGTDSHTPHCGALGCLAIGVGSTELSNSMVTGLFRLPHIPTSIKVEFSGTLSTECSAKDLILALLSKEEIKRGDGIGKIFEFCGSVVEELNIDERTTLTNMVAELGGVSGLVAPDEKTVAFLKERRGVNFEIQNWMKSDIDAQYSKIINICCDDIEPMLAEPGDPGNGIQISKLNKKVEVDIAYGGSCTAGKRSDFDSYFQVLKWADSNGLSISNNTKLYLQFGTMDVYRYCSERGYLSTFNKMNVILLMPGCGACANCGPGSSTSSNQVTISAINRNFPGRSGPGKVWLSNPETVVSSAIAGYIISFKDLKNKHQ
ncbi:aconitase family protein [Vibrio spartinae]|uniref:3-isopropylmalate dehydratase large subunit n=1 Tax=Vibrio spartinae TaxID=1918945 RepID=A0A1N6MBR3_9VIBR|nr:aconitase family protein [Vibrio spartinae]SIO96888.1 3-isopropylmalate dehydratase large subunit [Vibrio spartinae]